MWFRVISAACIVIGPREMIEGSLTYIGSMSHRELSFNASVTVH